MPRPNSEQNVTVLDNQNRFLEYTHPAVARKLLKEGVAKVWSRTPFAIKLIRAVDHPSYQRRAEMEVTSFTQYFRDEKEIYVQNVSNAQVSVAFEVATGHVESLLFPNKRDPINLTQYFPFGVIKNSMDFRKMLTRRPAALVLLSQDEYNAYYETRAREAGLFKADGKKKTPDIEAAISQSEEERRAYQQRAPLPNVRAPEPIHEVVEDDPHFGGRKEVRPRESLQVEDVVNPRILHLCNQVKAELTDQEKMPAAELLSELKSLEADLKIDDLEYVRAHGWYQSVKKWAKTAMAKVAEKEGVDDTSR